MPLIKPLAIGSLILLVACRGAPKKPTVEMGFIDYPRGEMITQIAPAPSPRPAPVRVAISQYDKATCFKPKEWEKVQNYIDELESSLEAAEKAAKKYMRKHSMDGDLDGPT